MAAHPAKNRRFAPQMHGIGPLVTGESSGTIQNEACLCWRNASTVDERTGAALKYSALAYITADKSDLYRSIMRVFVEAKAHFVLHLRPEEVTERLPNVSLEEVQAALTQLVSWGDLQAEPDMTRVTSVEDYYRAKFLYQVTREGEAAEHALTAYDAELGRRGALQVVALEDIRTRLRSLAILARADHPDAGEVALLFRNLSGVFTDLAENARAFMTGLGRTVELRGADRSAFIAYKERLVGYIERFISDLVTASAEIASLVEQLDGQPGGARPIEKLLRIVAERDAADFAPDLQAEEGADRKDAVAEALINWQAHWVGLKAWFVSSADHPSQATVLRASARRAINQLLEAVLRLNERRIGRSDRSADFRTLARWFMDCDSDTDAHRLWRTAFGLGSARHLGVDFDTLESWRHFPIPATRRWAEAPPIHISPRLRATGSYQKRGAPPKVQRRSREKILLARELAEETAEVRAARARLATGTPARLSELEQLDTQSFRLFLALIAEALAVADPSHPEKMVRTTTGDGSLEIELEPLSPDSHAQIDTPNGRFEGRDYRLRISDRETVEE